MVYLSKRKKSHSSVYSEEQAGVVTALTTNIRACVFSDATGVFGYIFLRPTHIKMFVMVLN